ncbi:MAG: polysaccharide deacetylase family protein [Clostridiales bacterium]|jgi:probable sporulation protein (polysaccharide deacetylase family)|nr:polysaccharide deacetylase family protein [Clostridiales bacterium]
MIIVLRRKHIISCLSIVLLLAIILVTGRDKSINVLGYSAVRPIYKGTSSVTQVAFECNVVWGTEYVPAMLDLLKDRNIRITFFIGGEWARENPELLRRMTEEGHELGNHGYGHKHHSKLSFEENCREIIMTEKIIEEITGIKTRLFAPPYGDFNNVTLQAADSLGYKTIMWSIDTIDWRGDGVDNIVKRVMKNPHNGAFILMHPTEDTITALPIIIEKLRQKGFEIGRISDLLSNGG